MWHCHLVVAGLRCAVVVDGSWWRWEVLVGAGDVNEVATLGGCCG